MDSIHDQRTGHDDPISGFAHRVERAIGRDLVGVFRADIDAGEQLVILTSQTGAGGADDVVRGLVLVELDAVGELEDARRQDPSYTDPIDTYGSVVARSYKMLQIFQLIQKRQRFARRQ